MSKHSEEKIDGIFTGFKILDYIKVKSLIDKLIVEIDNLGETKLADECVKLKDNLSDKIEKLWGRK